MRFAGFDLVSIMKMQAQWAQVPGVGSSRMTDWPAGGRSRPSGKAESWKSGRGTSDSSINISNTLNLDRLFTTTCPFLCVKKVVRRNY